MGTRADFYIGKGEDAEWLGSTAWDGYPSGIEILLKEKAPRHEGWPMWHKLGKYPEGKHLFDSQTEKEFKKRLDRYFKYRDYVSRPRDGWPWPWYSSDGTDYTYTFDEGKVWASSFGTAWFDPKNEPENGFELKGKTPIFPNMEHVSSFTMGKRSGISIINIPIQS